MPAKGLNVLSLDSVGTYGLNTQASPSSLEHQWLTEAENIMLDDQGRISSRQGIKQISDTIGTDSSNAYIIKSLAEYKKADGTTEIYCAANGNVYKLNVANSPYTLDVQTFTGTPATKTDSNWQFANFNNQLYGAQSGNVFIQYDGTNWMDVEDTGGYGGPAGITTFDPNCLLGEFGRLWVGGVTEANDVLYYSDTLIAHKWASGSAGSVDLKTVWGGDEIIALAGFMGKLVIFGKRNIAIYNSPTDPATMVLDEVIKGVGCVARDSVQVVGDDVIFLSNTGLRSLSRTKIQDKMPLTSFSENIKDALATHIVDADMSQVKAQYCICGGYYLLSFPDRNFAYAFDFKRLNPDQSPRITTWNFDYNKTLRSLLSTSDGKMYVGLGDDDYKGRVGQYTGYYDVERNDVTATYGTQSACETAGNVWESTNSKCWDTQNYTYQANFKTVWLDFGDSSVAKLLKRFLIVISGGKNMTASLNVFRDYESVADSETFSLTPNITGAEYLWGKSTSLYGQAKFAPSMQPSEYKLSLGKSAKVVRLGMIGTINGFKASIQNMTVWAKQGKIR